MKYKFDTEIILPKELENEITVRQVLEKWNNLIKKEIFKKKKLERIEKLNKISANNNIN